MDNKLNITEGSQVLFEDPQNIFAPEAQDWLKQHIRVYGQGPFKVARRMPEHVVLLDESGKIVHFGSTANVCVNIMFFRLFS